MRRASPALSIVINNYNYERFVGVAIESALAQRGAEVEVVVVDDGSTDSSARVIERYAGEITAVFKSNGGQASALNAGFRISSGGVVLFLDADDVLDEDAAATVLSVWTPGLAKVHFPLRAVDDEGRELGFRFPPGPLPTGDLRERIRRSGPPPGPPTSGNAFSRDVLERLLPMPEADWSILADAYLLLLAPLLGEVAAVSRPLGSYRVHGANRWTVRAVAPARLREYLEYDARRERMIRGLGPRFGVEVPPGWMERTANHLQARLASLQLDPAAHPHPGDRLSRLALRGMLAAARDPWFTPRKRLLFAAWFLLAGLLPRGAARRVIDLGYLPAGRPAWLGRLLGQADAPEPEPEPEPVSARVD